MKPKNKKIIFEYISWFIAGYIIWEIIEILF